MVAENSPFNFSLVYLAYYYRLQINSDLLLGFGSSRHHCSAGNQEGLPYPGGMQPCVETCNRARPRQLPARAGASWWVVVVRLQRLLELVLILLGISREGNWVEREP